MSCEHPICSEAVQSICTTHCHWSLCEDHLSEHRQTLLNEVERTLRDLMKPTSDLSQMIEEDRKTLDEYQKKELQRIDEQYREEIDQIEEKFLELDHFQEEYQELLHAFEEIQSNPALLTSDHFQKVQLLIEQFNGEPSTSSVASPTKRSSNGFQCPLTSLNLFGLKAEHRVRLCPPEKRIRHLMEHFRNYHHLNAKYAEALIQAIMSDRDPMKTKIFPDDVTTIIHDDQVPCPLHETPRSSGIRSTPCSSLVTEKLIRQHLKTVHRLPLKKVKKILEMY